MGEMMTSNVLWRIYFRDHIGMWKMALTLIPESFIRQKADESLKNPQMVITQSSILKYIYDKAWFDKIKRQYGDKGIKGLCIATADDILAELKPHTTDKKISIIYEILVQNKSRLSEIIEKLKKDYQILPK